MVVKVPFQTVTKLESAGISEDAFLASLLKQFPISESDTWLQKIQTQAADWVTRLQTPTKKDEEWRFTDLSTLLSTEFSYSQDKFSGEIIPCLQECLGSCLAVINGIVVSNLSDCSQLPEGVFVGSISQLSTEKQAQLQNYFSQQPGKEEVFTALNTAGFADVAIVWVQSNVNAEKPIQITIQSSASDNPKLFLPRILVVAETSSSFSLVEQYIGTGEETYFSNPVTEIWLQENAQVNHTRLQQETQSSFHIGKTAVSQARDSKYTINTIDLGGKLARHNLQILQTGENTETTHNGLTAAREEQLSDTHSAIALTKPYGKVNQLHKCIVDDSAHAVFNGKVFVPKEAQLTDAAQLNRNLLLSPKARVDTKPELQITADNVKCSHGATVSQLEADEVFYLRSRGLNEDNARRLLLDAFAAEIIQTLPFKSLQEQLSQKLI